MYAIIATGNKQYKVEKDSIIDIELIEGKEGDRVSFDNVLLVANGDKVEVGTPTVNGAKVSGTIVKFDRGPKKVVYKYKRKVNYDRETSHRQHYAQVKIEEVSHGS
ncbi:MAG: 50S ribosomal protein L21 [Candidatus Margulisiibacteriota bacterium]|nr:50S ribosomal protein L21 [Candidatus Margulisiibacteriota bacterium]